MPCGRTPGGSKDFARGGRGRRCRRDRAVGRGFARCAEHGNLRAADKNADVPGGKEIGGRVSGVCQSVPEGTARAAPVRCTVALAMARTDALGRSARENKDVQRAHQPGRCAERGLPRNPRFLGVGRPGGCRAQPGRPAGKVPDTRRTRRGPMPDRPMPVSDQPP